AVWDEGQARGGGSAWAVSHLDEGMAVLIVDEPADERPSAEAAGAARQYSGTLGGMGLCQVAVTLAYATGRGHTLIDRALYLPEGRAADEEHRELAGIPGEVLFASKPQLAGELLERAHAAGIHAAFAAGDEVYGGRELRRRRPARRGGAGGGAPRPTPPPAPPPAHPAPAAAPAGPPPPRAGGGARPGRGTKGPRHYDWAMLEVTSDDTPAGHQDGHSMLLIRRHRYTGTLSFYRCWTPGPAALSQLIAVAVLRWRIEEDHQIAKQATGLDAWQVIRWRSWHRWTAVCLLAYIYLAIAAAVQRQHDPSPPLAGLAPITAPELLRLLRGTVIHHPGATRPHSCTGRIGRDAPTPTPPQRTNCGPRTPHPAHAPQSIWPPER